MKVVISLICALLVMVELVSEANEAAYAHCSQILARGIYNSSSVDRSSTKNKYMIDWACNELKSSSSGDTQLFKKECDTTENSGEAKLGIDTVIYYVPLFVDGSYDRSNTREWCATEQSRASYRRSWYNNYCSFRGGNYASSDMIHYFVKEVDPGIVKAWVECIQKESDGLACYSAESSDAFIFNINWKSGPQPVMNAKFSFDNVESSSELPKTITAGLTQRIFKIKDKSKESIVSVELRNDLYTTSCNNIIKAKPEKFTCKDGNAFSEVTNERKLELDTYCQKPKKLLISYAGNQLTDNSCSGTNTHRVEPNGLHFASTANQHGCYLRGQIPNETKGHVVTTEINFKVLHGCVRVSIDEHDVGLLGVAKYYCNTGVFQTASHTSYIKNSNNAYFGVLALEKNASATVDDIKIYIEE